MSEAEIDQTLEDSFPASDPPSWTNGIERRMLSCLPVIEPIEPGTPTTAATRTPVGSPAARTRASKGCVDVDLE